VFCFWLELQAVRLNVGLNVYKAVLRATHMDLTDKTDERWGGRLPTTY
jgi:hypothetical protein